MIWTFLVLKHGFYAMELFDWGFRLLSLCSSINSMVFQGILLVTHLKTKSRKKMMLDVLFYLIPGENTEGLF